MKSDSTGLVCSLLLAGASTAGLAQGIMVTTDPPALINDYISLGEFDSDGDLQGWDRNANAVAALKVANGTLEVSTTSDDPYFFKTAITNVPAGFRTVEVRLKVLAGARVGWEMFWGSTGAGKAGFSGDRRVGYTLAWDDAEFHVLSFDMAEALAGDSLHDFRIDPGQTSGNRVLIDYVRIGIQRPLVPQIVSQPENLAVALGQDATLQVRASGAAPLSYQWRKEGLPRPDGTGSSLTITNAQPADAGTYDVVVTNASGSVTSATAMLIVATKPTITLQPQSSSVALGATAVFQVTAVGIQPLTYQWRKDASPLSGATLPMLTIPYVQLTDAGSYDVVIANPSGSVTSAPALLNITTPSPVIPQLQNATADTPPFSNSYPATAIDGFEFGDGGWSGSSNGGPATLVFQTETNIGFRNGSILTFTLAQGTSTDSAPNYQLGCFRLSATTDDRWMYADSRYIGGRVAANWTVLEPFFYTAANQATLTKQADWSLLASGGTNTIDTTYTVMAYTSLTNITGFRLEAITNANLPSSGPGRSSTGSFQLQEIQVGVQPAWTNPPMSVLEDPSIVPPIVESSPPLRMEQGQDGLEIAVPPGANSGVLLLFGSSNVDNLFTNTQPLLVTEAPVNSDLNVPVVPEERGFFYAIRRDGDVIDDYFKDDIPDAAPSPPFALWTLGLPTTLVPGISYTTDFLLVASTDEMADFNGVGQLSLIRKSDGSPHPDAMITPSTIQFTNGACRTGVQIAANSSLEDYWVAVSIDLPDSSNQNATNSELHVVAQSTSTFTLEPLINVSQSPASGEDAFAFARNEIVPRVGDQSWGLPFPLPAPPLALPPLPQVSGTFGEWRGHVRKGIPNDNIHAGLDLALDPGTPVLASRDGIVTAVGTYSGLGEYVVVGHYDGWYSRYLHLSPNGIIKKGEPVNKGDVLGKVGNKTEVKKVSPHLHFELRAGPPGLGRLDAPGKGFDPLQVQGIFPVRPPIQTANLSNIWITPNNPSSTVFKPPGSPTDGSSQTAYIVVRIKQPENGRRLAPRKVKFTAGNGGSTVELWTPVETDIEHLKPANHPANGGFALYEHGSKTSLTAADMENWFRYWFRWDVSGYAANPIGPRQFTIETENYAGAPESYTLKWGPEIVSIDKLADEGTASRFRVTVRAWAGEDASTPADFVGAGNWSTGSDWYRMILPEGGSWVGDDESRIENGGRILVEEDPSLYYWKHRTHEFLFDPSVAGQGPAKLRVESRTVPAIAHEITIGCGNIELLANGGTRAVVDWGDIITFERRIINSDGTSKPFPLTSHSWSYSYDWLAPQPFVLTSEDGKLRAFRRGVWKLEPLDGGCVTVEVLNDGVYLTNPTGRYDYDKVPRTFVCSIGDTSLGTFPALGWPGVTGGNDLTLKVFESANGYCFRLKIRPGDKVTLQNVTATAPIVPVDASITFFGGVSADWRTFSIDSINNMPVTFPISVPPAPGDPAEEPTGP